MTLPRLMVAPNGARLTKSDHPALPMTIAEITATAIECQAAGADGLHAHVRDRSGAHVLDAGLYGELLAEITHKAPDLYVQVTTEAVGRYSPAQQRTLVETLRPRAVSIALREITREADDRITARFFSACVEAGTEVQHILYDAADMAHLARLVSAGVIPKRGLSLLHVLGRYSDGQRADPADLLAALGAQAATGLSPDWAICAFGPPETDCLIAALKSGGKARIGFENNRVNRDGREAASNAERIADLRQAARASGVAL